MLASLARKVAFKADVNSTVPALFKELSAIREVAVIYPPGTLACPKDHITLSRMSPRQKNLLKPSRSEKPSDKEGNTPQTT